MSSGVPGYGPMTSDPGGRRGSANLADILERVLNTGIVIAGDIKVNLLDIELLTIQIRLLVVSVDRAEQMGIDWWRTNPALCSAARRDGATLAARDGTTLAAQDDKTLAAQRQPVIEETP